MGILDAANQINVVNRKVCYLGFVGSRFPIHLSNKFSAKQSYQTIFGT